MISSPVRPSLALVELADQLQQLERRGVDVRGKFSDLRLIQW